MLKVKLGELSVAKACMIWAKAPSYNEAYAVTTSIVIFRLIFP